LHKKPFTVYSGIGKGGFGDKTPPIGSEKKIIFLDIFLHDVKIVKIKKHLMLNKWKKGKIFGKF